jgi:hypothetical protein
VTPLDVVCLTVGVVGVASACWFYYHLWKWARDCQQATVAVAFKRKVVMSPTLVELLLWSRKVPDEQNGQVFYKGPNVTVAIIRRNRRTWWQRWQLRKRRTAQTGSTHGTWSIKQDKTNATP